MFDLQMIDGTKYTATHVSRLASAALVAKQRAQLRLRLRLCNHVTLRVTFNANL